MLRESEQQELDLAGSESNRVFLPSPKRDARRTRERRHLPWETNYASFSPDFAEAAVKQLCMPGRVRIFDPFAGNGTTLEAAAAVGVEAYGIELNPYSALLSRCRVSTSAELKVVTGIFRTATLKMSRSSKTSPSPSTPAMAVESLIGTLASRAQCDPNELVQNLCLRADNGLDSEVVVLVAALHVLKKQAAVHYRSNPAWLIQGHSPDSIEGEEKPTEDFGMAFSAQAQLMIEDLHLRSDGLPRRQITIYPGAFQSAPVASRQISRFLTSPPYLNRLDYVNPTLPELHVLGWEEEGRLEDLRSQMMGTTKMRRAIGANQLSSPTATKLLETIASHPTKASGTYYLKFFRQYFEDMAAFLQWLRSRSTPTCRGIVVLQDSFYKEIKVPIVKIISEFAIASDFIIEVLQEEKRIRHMGTLSPHQRTHAPNKALTEFTFLLERQRQ